MGDLISRQALCEYALNQKDKSVTPNDIMRFPSAQPERCEDCENFGKTRLLIPQPEIIHCENCKNWQTDWRNRDWGQGYHWCSCVDGVRRSDWFCADAERREDDQQ